MIDFQYLIQPPKKYTFEMPEVRLWAERWCEGKVLNLFAGYTKLDVKEVRVDIDEAVPADYHMDAFEFVKQCNDSFDTVLLDPPYNLRKAREKYGDRQIGSFTKIKLELPRILKLGGRVITFGYDSTGMSFGRGFEKIAICLVCHNGDHNDTIGLVEKYIQPNLF